MELTRIWPPLPIIIRDERDLPMPEDYNFVAAIVDPNRVYEINLHHLKRSQLQRLASAMQGQFSSLMHLKLIVVDNLAPELPNELLGRSAPRLQSLRLRCIAFHTLPRFLLSTTDLVTLFLYDTAYYPPEAIVSGLAVLSNLKYFTMGFDSSLSDADRISIRSPPLTHAVLPALTSFEFWGDGEYLESLVTRIDAPLLGSIKISFLHRLMFDTPQLAQFMRRTTRIGKLDEAHVRLYKNCLHLRSLPPEGPEPTSDKESSLTITCRKKNWRLSSISSLAPILTSFFPFIHMVEHLYIQLDRPRYSPSRRQAAIDNRLWLETFRLFSAVKSLYICKEFAEYNAFA